jgi:CBS-domain-containing membrane protein
MATVGNPIISYLDTVRINDICAGKGKLQCISSDASLKEVASTFQQNHISWLVIRDKTSEAYRCIHARDLASFLFNLLSMEQGHPITQDEASDISSKIRDAKAQDLSHSMLTKDFKGSMHVAAVVTEMAGSQPCCSHMPVVNEGGEPCGVISHLDIIDWLAKSPESGAMEWAYKTSASALGLTDRKLWCVNQNKPLVDVMRLMCTERLSGVCIVDDYHKSVGGFGPTDLFPMFEDGADLMQLNSCIYDYLHVAGRSTKPVQMQKMDASLGDIISSLSSNRVHCIFLANDEGVATSLVSCSDLIKCFAL